MDNIRSESNGDVLTVFLGGRVDTSNADAVEAAINAERDANPHSTLILDAQELEYISSSGLRTILRLRKAEGELTVKNVCSEVYDIFEMTGFTDIVNVEKAFKQLSVEGCEIIGKGAKGTIYRYDPETVVKVYNRPDALPDIQSERELARKAFVLGVPTAISYDIVKVGEGYASVFELIDSKSVSQLLREHPENLEEYAKMVADILRQMHSTHVAKSEMRDVKQFIRTWADGASSELSAEVNGKIAALIDGAPDTENLLHCDFHTNNIMLQKDELILIDMDTLSRGHPIFELANIHIAYVAFGVADPTVVENFLGLPYQTAVQFWNRFFALYLQTEDSERIREVEEKTELLSYLRLLRHVVRRGLNDDISRKTAEIARGKINELAAKVDSLDF